MTWFENKVTAVDKHRTTTRGSVVSTGGAEDCSRGVGLGLGLREGEGEGEGWGFTLAGEPVNQGVWRWGWGRKGGTYHGARWQGLTDGENMEGGGRAALPENLRGGSQWLGGGGSEGLGGGSQGTTPRASAHHSQKSLASCTASDMSSC
ncbi:hypothetical protein MPTK1_4g16130 [Marchantia polymorpha subsp. ruderalis]|uniref:Uncharacterized protein n=2 Tax=Marchantia polymorpha TaxID=3197 RepID=A0AAF6BAE8_MARPO|nr:hypothetical protein MARPO_0054s0078 [Marchantia polymorpha]BBN08982.1 hypothetical protein Mp_4g16130 [Marchantia polymorpha subsp. ruderalis]|eukprot:PTQ37969.1 hypothetical protein MARPO_0054s0078 [Marchantia polymorpha]